FSYDKKERTLDEIAKSVKLSKSTAFRILQNLKEEGFVTQHKERETYSLGPEIFRLGKVLDNPY
ncbi:MAG: helix-turn-helix domain-containing protein, partial [Deltaproteobacteria bacterium]|nr:helix-turn-helix domain-containing protein [Deltaproteobacteria bacterium]